LSALSVLQPYEKVDQKCKQTLQEFFKALKIFVLTMDSAQPIQKRLHLNPYDYHKYLINEYVLKKPGDTRHLHENDKKVPTKTIRDLVMENMQFIWNEDDKPATWEERLAKKYYDKLFREYCICDLSKFKENKIANRFRIEKEIISGKGQFVCAERSCKEELGLRTWEVNFAYMEAGEKKNALVKISEF
jgi:protein FRA10AC1